MDKTTLEKIVSLHNQGLNSRQISAELKISPVTAMSYLRRMNLKKPRKKTREIRRGLQAHNLGFNQPQAAAYSKLSQPEISRLWLENGLESPKNFPHLDKDELERRKGYLRSKGIDVILFKGRFSKEDYLPSVEDLTSNYEFFTDLCKDTNIDPKEIYRKCPQVISFNVEDNLNNKLSFLTQQLRIPTKKIAKKPRVLTNSMEKMQRIYDLLTKTLKSKEKAKKVLRGAITLLGNDVETIKGKLKIYTQEDIPFERNYSVLEKDPKKVIGTRDYLEKELGIPQNNYPPILLSVDADTLRKKIKANQKYKVPWRDYPSVLVLSVSEGKNEGTLERRINIIESNFPLGVPSKLDYQLNPKMLTLSEDKLRARIKSYKGVCN